MVTMMARSITVERSGTALPGLARVSGLGMGMGIAWVFFWLVEFLCSALASHSSWQNGSFDALSEDGRASASRP